MKRRITLIALVSSLAVLLTALLSGCGSVIPYADASVSGGEESLPLRTEAQKADSNRTSPSVTLDQAREIALTHAGVSAADVRWEDREFDLDDGTPLYELEFSANGVEYDCDVHAETGKIVKFESEKDDDRPAASTPATGKPASTTDKPATPAYIGLEKAKSIALKKSGVSASAVCWEKAKLDFDDGRPVYELEFRTGSTEYECEVHAVSGKILDYEADRHDDHHDHDDDHHDHDD